MIRKSARAAALELFGAMTVPAPPNYDAPGTPKQKPRAKIARGLVQK